MVWEEDQSWESDWHGDCANSYWEETKQIVYARKMGLRADMVNGKYPVYDLQGKSVYDIGAGPYSMLLKTINGGKLWAEDPCSYPQWTEERYRAHRISVIKIPAEEIHLDVWRNSPVDEVWIYNCLQHTKSPEKIIKNARGMSKIIRLFEWIDQGVSIGHPQNLTEDNLNKWLKGKGKVEELNESGCRGRAYYGVFLGEHYT